MSGFKVKLRNNLDPKWVEHQGKDFLYLQDPLMLSNNSMLIPAPIVPLLRMLDGTKILEDLKTVLDATMGLDFPSATIEDLINQLDKTYLLDNVNFKNTSNRFLDEYRDGPSRSMMHSGSIYPADSAKVSEIIMEFCEKTPITTPKPDEGALVGLLSPHIDFARGGSTYALTWQAAAPSLEDIELVIIFGTDHIGSGSIIIPTLQNYSTPFGVLKTDKDIVNNLISIFGPDIALSEELHHRSEHSIELAILWMHAFMKNKSLKILPVLCGSFYKYMSGDELPAEESFFSETLDILAEAVNNHRALIIAAGDLAHVGPVFGDSSKITPGAKHSLGLHDNESIAAICDGDAELFFQISKAENDKRRLCGMAPIYLMMKTIERAYGQKAKGFSMGYDQCPADINGGSLVTITGALLYA